MEVKRSASGDLLLGPPVRERVIQGLVALVMFVLVTIAIVGRNIEEGLHSLRQAGAAVFIVPAVLAAVGVWLARRERYRFDHVHRVVEQNGKLLCRYTDVHELLIEGRVERYVMSYRMKLLLRDSRRLSIGAKTYKEDEVNDAASSIASEVGVGTRVVR